MKNMVYIQSGGPTSVINSSLYGAYKEAKKHSLTIEHFYGSLNGVEGLINNQLVDLFNEDENEINLLIQTPGCILGSSRKKLSSDFSDKEYEKIIHTIKSHNIGYILVNGGNDSMDTSLKLTKLAYQLNLDFKVIGILKTVDNDLALTDHSLGFPTAAKYIINTMNAIIMDTKIYSKGKINIVEIMGRNAGWLTASCDLLPEDNRPDLFYIPETEFDLDSFLLKLAKIYEEKHYAVVAISEGIHLDDNFEGNVIDNFGHTQLGGVGHRLGNIVERKMGIKPRVIELSIAQRTNPLVMAKVDQEEAIESGRKAVDYIIKGETGKMVVLHREEPYQISYQLEDLSAIANHESIMDSSMLHDETRFSDKFRNYLKPLIIGETQIIYKDGIVRMCHLKKEIVK